MGNKKYVYVCLKFLKKISFSKIIKVLIVMYSKSLNVLDICRLYRIFVIWYSKVNNFIVNIVVFRVYNVYKCKRIYIFVYVRTYI